MLDRVLGLTAVLPFLLGSAAAPADGEGRVVLRLQDPEIVEASGLAVVDGRFVTHNDSGDSGRVFTISPDTGETVGVTTWPTEPEDLEAIAPAGGSGDAGGSPGQVWVGDIGDNPGERASISVFRVPVGPGPREVTPTAYELVYPDGPRDAESLLAHPRTGRLHVVSKSVFGGTLYAAPARLDPDRVNRLRRVGPVLGFATDGAFFPDGRHLVLRGYGSATVYEWPGLVEVGSFRLPDQQQGEGIAVDAAGRVYAGTEGLHAPVHRVPLPADVAAAVAPATPGSGAGPDAGPEPGPDAAPPGVPAEQSPADRPAVTWPWLAAGGLAVVAVGAVTAALLRRRAG